MQQSTAGLHYSSHGATNWKTLCRSHRVFLGLSLWIPIENPLCASNWPALKPALGRAHIAPHYFPDWPAPRQAHWTTFEAAFEAADKLSFSSANYAAFGTALDAAFRKSFPSALDATDFPTFCNPNFPVSNSNQLTVKSTFETTHVPAVNETVIAT